MTMNTIDHIKNTNVINLKNQPRFDGKELMWLNSRGGRDASDIYLDEFGRKYFLSWTPEVLDRVEGENRKVYVPTEFEEYLASTPCFFINKFGQLYNPAISG